MQERTLKTHLALLMPLKLFHANVLAHHTKRVQPTRQCIGPSCPKSKLCKMCLVMQCCAIQLRYFIKCCIVFTLSFVAAEQQQQIVGRKRRGYL